MLGVLQGACSTQQSSYPGSPLAVFIHDSGVSKHSPVHFYRLHFLTFLSQDHCTIPGKHVEEHSIALLTFSLILFWGRVGQKRAARNKSQSENEYKIPTSQRIHRLPLQMRNKVLSFLPHHG